MRVIPLLERQARLFALDESRHPTQIVLALFTCAALVVEYVDNESDKLGLLVAHLPSGCFRPEYCLKQGSSSSIEEAVKRVKDVASVGTIRAFYWGGSTVFMGGDGNEIDIQNLKDALGIKTMDVRENMRTVVIEINKINKIISIDAKHEQRLSEVPMNSPLTRHGLYQKQLDKKQADTRGRKPAGRCSIM